MSSFKQAAVACAFLLGLFAQLVPDTLEAQPGRRLGQAMAPGARTDIAGSVLENADEIGLTPDQVESLEALRADFRERAGAARERLEEWRAGLPQVREDAASVRSDMRQSAAELRAILTVEQMRELRRLRPGTAGLRGGVPRWRSHRRDRPFRLRGWSRGDRGGRRW